MLYNRYSIYVFNNWVKYALLRGRPWKSLRYILWNHMESIGTKAYTRRELVKWMSRISLSSVHIHTEITAADALSASAFRPLNLLYRIALRLAGQGFGWHPSQYVARGDSPTKLLTARTSSTDELPVILTGSPLGFFHCISARKT